MGTLPSTGGKTCHLGTVLHVHITLQKVYEVNSFPIAHCDLNELEHVTFCQCRQITNCPCTCTCR